MTHKEKILQFVENTGLNKTQFCKICGLSNGFLDSKGSITTDKLAQILEKFRNLNLNWLLLDEGEIEISEKEIENQVSESTLTYIKKIEELGILGVNTKIDNLAKDFNQLKQDISQTIEEKIEEKIKTKNPQ